MNSKSTEYLKLFEAQEENLPAIKSLLESVNLPFDGVKEHLTNFILLKKGNEVIGTIGLEIYHDKALLRSLAVASEYQRNGFGKKLYYTIIEKSRERRIRVIYLLTEIAEGFFAKEGFEKIARDLVDDAVKQSVEFRSACPASAVCLRLAVK